MAGAVTKVQAIKRLLALPPSLRRWALKLADWERQIAEEANYILSDSIRHPVNDIRAARRAIDLATARALVLRTYPELTRAVLVAGRVMSQTPHLAANG